MRPDRPMRPWIWTGWTQWTIWVLPRMLPRLGVSARPALTRFPQTSAAHGAARSRRAVRLLRVLLRLLSQHVLLDLAGAGLRQVVDDDDAFRHLEPREPLAGERLQRLDVGLLGARRRDERDGHLAPPLVGRGDHCGLRHRLVSAQRLLDFDRGDVLAARDDHV